MGFAERIKEVYNGPTDELLEGLKEGHTTLLSGEAFPKYERLETEIAQYIVPLFQRTGMKHKAPENNLLTSEQKKAISALFETETVLLSGGPGTGKTFTIAEACKELAEAGIIKSAIVAAPTGKAASLLASAIQKKVPDTLSITTGTLSPHVSYG